MTPDRRSNRTKPNRPPDRGGDAWAATTTSVLRTRTQTARSGLCRPLEASVGRVNGFQRPASSRLNRPRCPDGAPAKDPAAFNAHSPGGGGSGLVQHVFRSPARIPTAEPPRGGPCAAPPSEKRYSFNEKRYSLSPIRKAARGNPPSPSIWPPPPNRPATGLSSSRIPIRKAPRPTGSISAKRPESTRRAIPPSPSPISRAGLRPSAKPAPPISSSTPPPRSAPSTPICSRWPI